MIKIRIKNEEMIRVILKDRLRHMGFKTFGGHIEREKLYHSMTDLFLLFPTRRDLIFKGFGKWSPPPWQKRKEIVFRSFKKTDGSF